MHVPAILWRGHKIMKYPEWPSTLIKNQLNVKPYIHVYKINPHTLWNSLNQIHTNLLKNHFPLYIIQANYNMFTELGTIL